jgi:hypothetical protein
MKALGAFGLGVVSFLLFMFFGESFGMAAAFVALIIYFFVCQSILSRGHVGAHKEDLGLMFALDAVMFFCALLVICVEKPSVIASQIPVMFGATCAGTSLGAVVASRTATRRSAER